MILRNKKNNYICAMAINKNALIRYRIIDKCLQNKYRKWTLNNLIEECSNALYDYEGRNINVSKRTVQMDIQIMRSDKLGYNAPIEVYDKKYYRYKDLDFSINNIPLTENDMNVLSETIEILKQFKNISLFSELNGVFQKLEDKIYAEKDNIKPIIYFEKNENLKGLKFIDLIYQAIQKKIVLNIEYKPFQATKSFIINFTPYILKTYNNRWFVIGNNNETKRIQTSALDRIKAIDYNLKTEYINDDFDGDDYYKNTIGVTVLWDSRIRRVVLKIDKENAPYIVTKPFHKSQKIKEKLPDGSIIIQITVHLNYELDRLILGFGESIEVVSPKSYRDIIIRKLSNAVKNYK